MPRKKHTKCSTDGCIGIRALRGNAARYQKIDPNNPLCATPWCGKPHTVEHVTLSGNTLNATRWCHTCLKDPSRRYRMPVPGIDKFRSKAPPR